MLKTGCLPSGHFWPIIHFLLPELILMSISATLFSLDFSAILKNCGLNEAKVHIQKPKNIKELKIFCMIPLEMYPMSQIFPEDTQQCYFIQKRVCQIVIGRYQQFLI